MKRDELMERLPKLEHEIYGIYLPRGLRSDLRSALEAVRELTEENERLRKQAARYRKALIQYADPQNWTGEDDLYPDDGPQAWFGLLPPNGYEIAREALLHEDGEEAENATKSSE